MDDFGAIGLVTQHLLVCVQLYGLVHIRGVLERGRDTQIVSRHENFDGYLTCNGNIAVECSLG